MIRRFVCDVVINHSAGDGAVVVDWEQISQCDRVFTYTCVCARSGCWEELLARVQSFSTRVIREMANPVQSGIRTKSLMYGLPTIGMYSIREVKRCSRKTLLAAKCLI